MSYGPENSRIKMDDGLEAKVAAAKSGEEICQILRQAMIDQRLIIPDAINKSVFHELTPPEPKAFVKTITEASGRELYFQGSTELELEKNIGAYYRALQPHEPARDSQGKFVRQPTQQEVQQQQRTAEEERAAAARAAAETQVLSELGIDVDAVRELSEKKFTDKWASATERFKEQNRDWPGGEENTQLIGQLIIDNNLQDGDPLQALQTAYQHAVENDLLVKTREMSYAEEIAKAKTSNEIEEINGRYFSNSRAGAQASGFFNRR
jgi:hypothetical protein